VALFGCLHAALSQALGMQKGALSQAEEERPNRPFLASQAGQMQPFTWLTMYQCVISKY